MNIKIAERLRPFSHLPGTYFLLPGSTLRLQIFPALLVVHDLLEAKPKLVEEIPVPVKGPVKEFTIQLDLEKGVIHVWGESAEGYFRYQLSSSKDSQLIIKNEKGLKDWYNTSSLESKIPPLTDRLSLGNHKSQDWEGVIRRSNLEEILPAWLRLGQLIEEPQYPCYEGTAALLKRCQKASLLEVYDTFQNLFAAGFQGLLSPCLTDEKYLGFELSPPPPNLSPLFLLTEGAKIIRSLFFRIHHTELFILPNLPPQFHCGRFLQVQCENLGLLDFEWTKKSIRRMIFHSDANASLKVHFPKNVKRFRLNGEAQSIEKPLEVEKGKTYFFDRFEN